MQSLEQRPNPPNSEDYVRADDEIEPAGCGDGSPVNWLTPLQLCSHRCSTGRRDCSLIVCAANVVLEIGQSSRMFRQGHVAAGRRECQPCEHALRATCVGVHSTHGPCPRNTH